MCRLAAYAGPPRSLADLWLAPPHSLEVQSYAPKRMDGAILNADGFGMAWYTPAAETPARYRTVLPLWADENVRAMAAHLVSGCAVANVRSATAGMPVALANVSPFVEGRWVSSHNGYIADFHARHARGLRGALDDARYASIVGNTDSEHLHALLMSRLDGLPRGADPTPRVREVIADVARRVGDSKALLNLVVSDGEWVVATRHAVNGDAPSLFTRVGEGAVEIASEPLDDAGWREVPTGSVLTVDPARELTCRPL